MTRAADRATFEVLDPERYATAIDELGEILADAVDSGTPMHFVQPFSAADGAAWFRSRLPDVAAGTIRPIVALVDGRIDGVAFIVHSTFPNAPHRAEIAKVAVHRRSRGQGLGLGLMTAAEAVARADGRWLLILDTVTGSPADRMYRRLGWQEVGTIADYALLADGVFAAATYFVKDLRGRPERAEG